MKKLAMCMMLALVVSCGEDEGDEPKKTEPTPLSLEGEIEGLVCDGADAVYTIKMRGNAKLSCTSRPDFARCSGWPEEVIGERSFTVRCDGDKTFSHELTCRDLREPEATKVVLYPTEQMQPAGPKGWCS